MPRLSIFCLAALSALLSFCDSSVACSLAACPNNGNEVRAAFTIFVTHHDRPLSGVSFRIVAKGAEQFSGITDDSGAVHVKTLAPGLYWLTGNILGTGVVYTCVNVRGKPSRKAKSKLTYTWGDEAPTSSRIAGRLVVPLPGKGGTPLWNITHKVDVPLTAAGLTLRDSVSHAAYATTSDKEGLFSFEGLPRGTYVLHIEGGSADEFAYDPADSVIELTDRAKRADLLFKGGPSGCGGNELALED